MPESSTDGPAGIDHAEATRVTREHEKARQRAIDDTAERNRKAHELAKKERRNDEQFRRNLRKGLDY
jgi:hypothetical protein